MKTCKANNLKGGKCSAPCMKGSDYCYWHNPAIKEKRANDYKTKVGRKKSLFNTKRFEGPRDVQKLLEEVVNAYNRGKIDSDKVKDYRRLCEVMLSSMEQGKIADRIDDLREQQY